MYQPAKLGNLTCRGEKKKNPQSKFSPFTKNNAFFENALQAQVLYRAAPNSGQCTENVFSENDAKVKNELCGRHGWSDL